jgi:hypothetical protein
MMDAVQSVSQSADWKPGDRVKTLDSSLRGTIVRILENGRMLWKPDGAETELTALPESLARDG